VSPRRVRPAGRLRALAALALALPVATCRDAVGPGTPTRALIAVSPVLPSEAALADFGLSIDAVRFIVVRPAADTLADTTLVLPPDSGELALDLRVAIVSVPETLRVSVVALSGTLPLFAGTRSVPVPSTVVTSIPVDSFVGPVADSIVIQPRAAFIALNDSLRFQVQGFNGGVPVTQFYVAWSSSDSAVAPINRFGVLRAPGTRASVRVRARTPTGATDSVTATFAPPATQLVAIAGGGQTDTVGTSLAAPLEVEARAADGVGVGGVSVRFRGLTGGAAVADSVVVTDVTGRARTTATLGGTLGIQSFQASVSGLSGSPVTFNATALAGPPVQLLAVAGDAQLAVVSTLLPTAPRVQVRDAGGNGVAGVAITFTVASGGGSRTGGSQVSDSGGFATVGGWTLGTLAGTNSLTATGAGLTRTFTATGVAGPATLLVATAGNLQSAVVGSAVATDPTVRAQDQFGNPVAGASISFSVSGGGGSVTGAAQLTNAAGVATVGSWTLGTTVGGNTLTATLSGVTPVVFSATATAGGPTQIVKVSGDSQTSVVNTAVGTAPRVRLTDQFGNPVAGSSVTFAVASGGGGVTAATQTTDTAGVATVGGWTLGTAAGPNSVTATAGALSTTFTATAIAGAPTQIAHFAGDLQSAVVNAVVPIAPAVVVRDQFNNAVPGVGITFTVDSGGGSVTGAAQITDTTGRASVGSWRLGTLAGANGLSVTGGSLTTTFSATGLAGPATQLVKVAGDGLASIVGTALGTPPAVRALDQYGNAVANLGVTFAVTGGGGSVTGPAVTTNGTGLAAVGAWTLDTIAGANAVTASAGALSAGFTATGLAAAPNRITKLLGDGQTGVVNTTLPVAPSVRLSDRYGNPIVGDTIDFFLLTDGGSLPSPAPVTDAAGTASAGPWTIANFVAQNTLQATVHNNPGVPAARFTATGTPDVPAQLFRVSLDTQTAIAGQQVNLPPEVSVADQFGNHVPGVSVTFTLTGPLQGSVSPGSAPTDSVGVARVTTWTLDSIAGLNTLDASVPGLTGSPVSFSASGVTTTATAIALDAGNSQQGIVNTALATPYSVLVTNAGGAPVQNVQVHWAVGVGGGLISPSTSATDVNGIASATRTLGVIVGPQTATASVGGLTGSPVTFNAAALPDVPAALIKQSADPQTATVATSVTAPVVEVTDQFGNTISGVEVSFAVAGGTIGATLDTTDATGRATAGTWTLGSLVGDNTVTVSSGGLAPVSFTATGTAAAASVIALLDGNGQTGTVGQALAAPYRVHVTDAFGNDVGGATVNWSIAAGGSGAIAPSAGPTDGSGVAAATHTLGTTVGSHSAFAWITGVPDTVTFTSTALAGAAATIAKAAGDSQTATVNTALSTRPTVLVTDQFGAPVAGQPVSWAVATGGGSLGTPTTVTSDALGIATSPTWTLGTGAGTNTLTATATGLAGSPVTFTATGTAGAATQMVIKDGNNQSEVVATALPIKPSVAVRDQFNNPVGGVKVTFAVTLGGGAVTGPSPNTDAQGIATVGSWTLGSVVGLNGLSATATGVQGVSFTATGLPGLATQLAFLTEPSHTVAGNAIAPPVRVAFEDGFGNVVTGATGVVTLKLGASPDPAAKLTGSLSVGALGGIAQFPDLQIDSAGIGYTFDATAGSLAKTSQAFDIGGVIAAFLFDRWQPVAAAVNPVTRLAYIPGLNNSVGVLDPGKSLVMVPGFETPFGVAVNSLTNRIYVTTLQGVVVLNGQNNVMVATIPVGPNPKGIAVDEATDRIYVAVEGDPSKDIPPTLVPIDGSKNTVVTADIVPFPAGVGSGIGVAFNPRDGFVYVAIPVQQEVLVIDPTPGKTKVAAEVRGLGKFTYDVGVDGRNGLLFATNQDEGTVSVIDISAPDPGAFKEIQRVVVGRLPQGIGVDADRNVVYVANSGEATVTFIEIGKLSVFATLFVGQTPKTAAVNIGNGQFFVPTFGDDRVRMVQP
jgi:adhesin/invasin